MAALQEAEELLGLSTEGTLCARATAVLVAVDKLRNKVEQIVVLLELDAELNLSDAIANAAASIDNIAEGTLLERADAILAELR